MSSVCRSPVTTVAVDTWETDAWIAELTRRGWTHVYFPNVDKPTALASAFWHGGYFDVIELFAENDAFAYRAPMAPGANPFKPDIVRWYYNRNPVWTIRAMLALPDPWSPLAPVADMPSPPMCRALPELMKGIHGQVVWPPSRSHRGGTQR